MLQALGRAQQSAIAGVLRVSRAAVTQRLAAFTARGWVEVRPHHSDGRTNLVSLTAAGADLSTAAWQGLAASHDGADDGVDHVQLQRSLERVIGNAERHLS
ncbi:MarR family winged helix-turn-helix transcriptional regulator [Microbacterium aurum]